MEVAIIVLCIVVVGLVGVLFFKKGRQSPELDALKERELQLEEEVGRLREENGKLNGRLENSVEVFKQKDKELEKIRTDKEKLIGDLNTTKAEASNLREKLDQQKEDIQKLQEQFTREFQNLANKILKENTEEFSKTNREKLGDILNPLKEKIEKFEKQVEEKHKEQVKDTAGLKQEIKGLMDLNTRLSKEAENLTKALKGDTKKQGNWGEVILERVLEMSGLRKDLEYFTQYSDENAEGKRIQPDIVVKLPEEKHIIIDSKVSLVDYERFIAAETDDDRQLAQKAHINSVKTHIKNLSEKNYPGSKTLQAPDFVLLFLPIESSFSLAIQNDPDIFNFAWDRKIVLVSPSTLLATLRTIASVWKQERQSRNAMEIARKSGQLYDKFVGFLGDLKKIDRGLESSRNAYDEAVKKLSTGKGNLIRSTEKLRELGAKNSKPIPDDFREDEDKPENPLIEEKP